MNLFFDIIGGMKWLFASERKTGAPEYLIVGLGNPESRYAATRHNIGFEAAAILRAMEGFSLEKGKLHSLLSEGTISGKKCLICRPQTYMNLSGDAVSAAASYYHIDPDHIIVIYDDVSLPLGALRLRHKGSAGGHNGMKDIIAKLHTEDFLRIRIGVGEKPEYMDLKTYVLSKFTKEELPVIKKAAEEAAEAARCIVTDGMDKAMNLFNSRKGGAQ